MVDNFEKLADIIFSPLSELNKDNRDHIIAGQVIRRSKDGGGKDFVVRRYKFDSKEVFLMRKEEIVNLCEAFEARFYISVNIKSQKSIAFDMSIQMPLLIRNETYHLAQHLYDSVVGSNTGIREYQNWILDLDDINEEEFDEWFKEAHVKYLFGKVRGSSKTFGGYHVFVKPFDIREFSKDELNKGLEVKKNALTLVYYNRRK